MSETQQVEQELLSIVATAHLSHALTCMESHENSSHARRVQSMIHLLIELYGNWGEDSETKWKYKSETKPKNKSGGTKSKISRTIFLKRYTCCRSEPHPLPAWRSCGS